MDGISTSTKQTKHTKTLHWSFSGQFLSFSEKCIKASIVETAGLRNFPLRWTRSWFLDSQFREEVSSMVTRPVEHMVEISRAEWPVGCILNPSEIMSAIKPPALASACFAIWEWLVWNYHKKVDKWRLYSRIRMRRGLNKDISKNVLQFLTKGSSGFFWESTSVPKATLPTTSKVKQL